ncbi:hypothetical protein [Duganella callida]|uniref:Uncharacterized protein n=1 Tax=Duganella callida TaxID=2561932 RepID=A0A4Y9SMG5_9BURK|nr:hypothetical protein [Duganella callida]TFW27840.1 hypothetical protein E4L98_06335 [Duganella callida]
MLEFEKWLARVLLLNSALALGVCLGLLGEPLDDASRFIVFGAALLGFLSAVAGLKHHWLGLWGAGLYYFLQLVSYFPLAGGWQFAVKAGVNLGLVLRFSSGVLVLNMVALGLFVATAVNLAWRLRHARTPSSSGHTPPSK